MRLVDNDSRRGEAKKELDEEGREDDQIGILAGMKGPEVGVGGNHNLRNEPGLCRVRHIDCHRNGRGGTRMRCRASTSIPAGVGRLLTTLMSDEEMLEEARMHRESFAAVFGDEQQAEEI